MKNLTDDSIISDVGFSDYLSRSGEFIKSNNEEIMNNVNWSKIRTIAYFAIVFFIAGLNALKGSIPMDITGVLSILGIVETALYTPEVPTV